ncbi:MAG: 3-phosphoshikimate 1-carboxyvinyltransferase [Massilibacteroides sp.]|nr:3-phosphoshikimate 1-carboxyvinyltransferase [Massilibacteroides sp.]MDD3063367.1 3-phosphoshikimate 1-carboxyvinyltransferase [Massilibacteroides sp.]MDD4114354.1 3-phosphoshikimate 1-carboxyvinyltransferase [Massilibacteroides sp.]MDD4659689.1 3-phosphoshikimate 1-carboxyvinyltransferase [Massilibacteroides sp.]
MTKYLITVPSGLRQESISLPASKSISNRVLILNALSYSPYEIKNLSDCDDTEVLIAALTSNSNHFDIKAAGTAMRFLTAFLSKVVGEWTITGTERMCNRPIKLLVDALNSVGAKIEYMEKEGFPPLRIYGSVLQGGDISLDGGVSSQYISALLMVAPLMEKGLVLHLNGEIISRPYIHITLALMKQFGVSSSLEGNTIRVSPQEYTPVPFIVESDWSAASYWYAVSCLSGCPISLTGLYRDSLQGDAVGAKLFEQLGVNTAFTEEGVCLKPEGDRCEKLIYDFVNEPDLAQTFTVVSVLLNIPFNFCGLQSLKIKETDRIAALIAELRKLGYVLRETQGGVLEWDGERCESEMEPVIATYEDHRMAMAFAPAALVIRDGIRIAEPGVVSKSYPRFWEDLEKVGFKVIKI